HSRHRSLANAAGVSQDQCLRYCNPVQPTLSKPMSSFPMFAVAALFSGVIALSPATAEEQSKCDAAPPALWGDGEHDDTAALNAWFRGETVIWAQTHEPVGAAIADRTFLLSSVVYIASGTGRRLERFRLLWLWRDETV